MHSGSCCLILMLRYKHVILCKRKNNNNVVDPRYVSLNHHIEDFVWPKHPPKGAGAPEQGADQVLPAPPADHGADDAPDQVPAPPADEGAVAGAADLVPTPPADQGSDRAFNEEDTGKEVPVSPPPAKKIWKDVPAKNQFQYFNPEYEGTLHWASATSRCKPKVSVYDMYTKFKGKLKQGNKLQRYLFHPEGCDKATGAVTRRLLTSWT